MNQPPHRTEREFGVPFPGEVVDAPKWTQSALKTMPDGRLNWAELFGRTAPVVLDLGCGNGRFLIGSAVSRPGHDHLGTDILPVVIRYARKRANQRGLANIKFAVLGAHELLEKFVEPGSVAEIHCYHPQPYYDPAQAHRRLITPAFLALVHRTLAPAGCSPSRRTTPATGSTSGRLCRCSSTSTSGSAAGPTPPRAAPGARSLQ
jgi:tRNA (guanine-N7-)-methyltransferase